MSQSASVCLHCASAEAEAPLLVLLIARLSTSAPAGFFIDEVSCGMHHVVAVGRPLDRRAGRPADHAPRGVFAWGRGSEGQLGVKSFEDSPAPVSVEALKGRSVLQVGVGAGRAFSGLPACC